MTFQTEMSFVGEDIYVKDILTFNQFTSKSKGFSFIYIENV